MGGNDVGDVVDGNVASKAGDVGDNGGMICEGEGGVENSCGIEVSRGGMEVSSMERPEARPPG